MPLVSFLVALDTGSDLTWVPCDCLQCAPLSASYYNARVWKHFLSMYVVINYQGLICKIYRVTNIVIYLGHYMYITTYLC